MDSQDASQSPLKLLMQSELPPIAFWDFTEKPGEKRTSKAGSPLKLEEVGGPIERVEAPVVSGCAAHFDGSHYFVIPRAKAGDLDIHGPEARLTLFAVVKIFAYGNGVSIAGMWDEGDGPNDDSGTRQYAMILNMPTYGGTRQICPHVSSEGGVTRRKDGSGFPWCADYAAGKTVLPENEWMSLAFTYDGTYIRAYVNGLLDRRDPDPQADKRTDPYFTTEGPDGGNRGMNPFYHGRGIFHYDPVQHRESKPRGPSDFTVGARKAVGSMLGEALQGQFAGLAVFNESLNEEQIKRLHTAAFSDNP